MRQQNQESYRIKKFGKVFKMYRNGTIITACLIHSRAKQTFVGRATLHAPDIYDQKLGELIAIKSAMNKCDSFLLNLIKRRVAGLVSNTKYRNAVITKQIEMKRTLTQDVNDIP